MRLAAAIQGQACAQTGRSNARAKKPAAGGKTILKTAVRMLGPCVDRAWCRVTDHLSVCAGHRSAARGCIACQYSSVWAARCALRCAPMAARSLRHLFRDTTLARLRPRPCCSIASGPCLDHGAGPHPKEHHMTNTDELKSTGLKATLPRLKILDIFQKGSQRHMTAEDVFRVLLQERTDIGLATVYRVLTQFAQAGILSRSNFESGKSVYELNEGLHHDHFICTSCGKVEEFYDPEIEKRQQSVAKT